MKIILSLCGCFGASETKVKRRDGVKITFSLAYRTVFFYTTQLDYDILCLCSIHRVWVSRILKSPCAKCLICIFGVQSESFSHCDFRMRHLTLTLKIEFSVLSLEIVLFYTSAREMILKPVWVLRWSTIKVPSSRSKPILEPVVSQQYKYNAYLF